MKLSTISIVSLSLAAAVGAPARAGGPTVDAVKAALPTWTSAIALPFAYQGLTFQADDSAKADACTKAFGAHGVVKDAKALPKLVDCLAISNARDALMGKPTVAAFDAKHAPDDMSTTLSAMQIDSKDVQKGYPAKLPVAKGGGMVYAHATKPDDVQDYWSDAWNVYAVHADGAAVKFDGVVVIVQLESPD